MDKHIFQTLFHMESCFQGLIHNAQFLMQYYHKLTFNLKDLSAKLYSMRELFTTLMYISSKIGNILIFRRARNKLNNNSILFLIF